MLITCFNFFQLHELSRQHGKYLTIVICWCKKKPCCTMYHIMNKPRPSVPILCKRAKAWILVQCMIKWTRSTFDLPCKLQKVSNFHPCAHFKHLTNHNCVSYSTKFYGSLFCELQKIFQQTFLTCDTVFMLWLQEGDTFEVGIVLLVSCKLKHRTTVWWCMVDKPGLYAMPILYHLCLRVHAVNLWNYFDRIFKNH